MADKLASRAQPLSEPLQGHIGWVEASGLLLITLLSKVFLIYPVRMAMDGQTAAWSLPILSGMLSAIWLLPLSAVLSNHPGQGIIEITRALLGKFLAFLFGILYYVSQLALIALSASEISDALTGVMLPRTPRAFLLTAGLAIALYLATKGLETVARMSVPLTVVVILYLIATSALSLNQWNADSVFPLLGPGAIRLAKSAVVRQYMYGEILSLGILAPYLQEPKQAGRIAWGCTLVSGAVFILVVLTCQMVFPYPTLSHAVEPVLRVTRLIYLGRFFQRFDAILSPIWLSTATLRVAAGIALLSTALSAVTSIKSLGVLMALTAAATGVLAAMVPDMATNMILSFDVVRPYSVILLMAWPIALWIADKAKRPADRPGRRLRQ